MQQPLVLFKKDNLFVRNPLGCVGFVCLALLGALIGRAVFCNVYEGPALSLLNRLPTLARPRYRSASVLLSAILPCAIYCALQLVAGFRRAFLPLWATAALGCGVGWGMQLGLANVLLQCAHTDVAILFLLAPMLLTCPLYLYVALLPLARLRDPVDADAPGRTTHALLNALPASILLIALQTLLSTLACAFGMRMLLD